MSPEEYRRLREKETAETKKKRFSAVGPQSFKSRSLQSFQKDMEDGKAGHLMPVFNSKEKLKKGEIKQKDIPYMQRLGSWDDSDIGKKKKWREEDKRYSADATQSLDWKGQAPRSRPQQQHAQKNQDKPKKKLFGFF
jgi:hypothetical protein